MLSITAFNLLLDFGHVYSLLLVEVPRTAGQRILVMLPIWEDSVCKFLMEGSNLKMKMQEAR